MYLLIKLDLFFILHLFTLCECVYACVWTCSATAQVNVRRQLLIFGSLPSTMSVLQKNLGCQVWQHVPSPAEPSYQDKLMDFNDTVWILE